MEAHLITCLLQIGILLMTLALLVGWQAPSRFSYAIFLLATLALLHSTFFTNQSGTDARFFWQAGHDLRNGLDPYARPVILNPPTAFLLYLLIAALPQDRFLLLWQGFQVAGCVVLVFLVQQTLNGCPEFRQRRLPTGTVALVAAAVFLSFACRYGIFLGQLSILVTLALTASLWFQNRDRPLAAGACLALASIKPATMLPFLLLFLRKKNWKTWLALAICGFGLALAIVPPRELPTCLDRCLHNIRQASKPGHVNDYSFASMNNRELISFDYAFYHLGLRDRDLIQVAQWGTLGLLGGWVAWQVTRNGKRSWAASCSLVACYAALFLYHRLYDMLILVIPLVYSVAMVRTEAGKTRGCYLLTSLAILGVLYLRLGLLKDMTAYAMQPGLMNRFVEALVLPYGTWLVVVALLSLAAGEKRRCQERTADPVVIDTRVKDCMGDRAELTCLHITTRVSDASPL